MKWNQNSSKSAINKKLLGVYIFGGEVHKLNMPPYFGNMAVIKVDIEAKFTSQNTVSTFSD